MIYIFGNGGLAHEFVSFGGFESKYVTFISKENEDSIDWHLLREQDVYVLIADCTIRRKVISDLTVKGISVNTFVHPTAFIGHRTTLGQGCVIAPNCIISNDVKIGTGVFVNSACSIGHDTEIGDFVSIMPGSFISGNNIIGHNSSLGTGTMTVPGIKICDNTKTGIGSILIRGTKKAGLYSGNPAQFIL